jgi:hypothetical protein
MNLIRLWPLANHKAEVFVIGSVVLVLPLILIQFAALLGQPMFYGHDEIEHLSAVFAIERGERPYLDFFENHPLLPHVLLSWFHRWIGMNDVGQIYQLAMGLILLHVAGCFVLLFRFYTRFVKTACLPLPSGVPMWIALGLLTPWQESLSLVWQLRPDWICYFWALLGIFLHMRLMQRWCRGESLNPVLWVTGGLVSGFAIALLPKAAFLFLPYGMSLLIMLVADSAQLIDVLRLRRRALLTVNLGFLILAVVALVACIAGELYVTGTSLEAYYKANISLNALRHPVKTFNDAKLFDVLAWTSAGHLLLVLAGLMMLAVLFLRLARSNASERFGIYSVLGMLLVVIVNGLLPAFSNGGQWSHNYIPALMMFYLLTALALSEGWHQLDRLTTRWMHRRIVLWGVGLVSGMLFLVALWQHYAQALDRFGNMKLARQLLQISSGTDGGGAMPDRLLPPGASYLSFDPIMRPARGKFWGYYFMLAADRGMWQDAYRLNLGPDPATHWQTLWHKQPPEVVLVSSPMDLQYRIEQVRVAQQLDVSWLDAALGKDYVCLIRSGLAAYVHRQALGTFADWRPCVTIRDERLDR